MSSYASPHVSSHGPMPMTPYLVMWPQPRSSPTGEFKRYSEAIQDRARPSERRGRRRLAVQIWATELEGDWLSGLGQRGLGTIGCPGPIGRRIRERFAVWIRSCFGRSLFDIALRTEGSPFYDCRYRLSEDIVPRTRKFEAIRDLSPGDGFGGDSRS